MPETDRRGPTTPQTGEVPNIIYAYGKSTLGDFIAAVDQDGLCAILFGDNQADLFNELGNAFPKRGLTQACPTYGGFQARTWWFLHNSHECWSSASGLRLGELGRRRA